MSDEITDIVIPILREIQGDISTLKDDVTTIKSDVSVLKEAVTRIAVQEMGKTVGILSPVNRPAASLVAVASFLRHIRPTHLARAQFPSPLPRPGDADLVRPVDWA